MALVRLFKIICVLVIFLSIAVEGNAQDTSARKSRGILKDVQIDSLLQKYHLDGVRIFVKKLGVFSVKEKNVSLKRKDLDDRLYLNFQRSLSMNRDDYSLSMEYRLTRGLFLKGESAKIFKGTKNSLNLLYKIEY
ncbi:MAG: hypothetical protein AB7W47_03450 [Calditrichaceae bacterium]